MSGFQFFINVFTGFSLSVVVRLSAPLSPTFSIRPSSIEGTSGTFQHRTRDTLAVSNSFFNVVFLFGQSGDAVKELYNQLGEKLELRKPSPAQVADAPSMDLSLPTVPTPTPL